MLNCLDKQRTQGSVLVSAPGGTEFRLSLPPVDFAGLVYAISQHFKVDPDCVKLTYTQPESGQRLMLVGDQRYREALVACRGKVLILTVVLLPLVSVSSPSERMKKGASNLSFETAGEEAMRTPRREEVKRQLRSILDNTQHYLSDVFKDALFDLMSASSSPSYDLNLTNAKISAYESVLLSEVLQLMPSTRALKLRNNKLGNDGLATICQALPDLTALEELDLTNTQISSKGVQALSRAMRKLPHLRLLHVAGNGLRTEDTDLIMDAAPSNCRIVHDKKSDCSLM